MPPAVEVWSPNHWTAREVLELPLKIQINTLQRKIIVLIVSTCNIHSVQCSIRSYIQTNRKMQSIFKEKTPSLGKMAQILDLADKVAIMDNLKNEKKYSEQ